MSLLLTVTAATQLCTGCTIEFEPLDTLGAAEDPAGVGILAEVLDMGDRGYLVSSEVLGGVVIVYDSEGRYQRELTREGDGPGELRDQPMFAMGPGGIVLFDSPRLHFYSSDLGFTKTLRVSGIVRTVLWDTVTQGWLVTYRGVGDRAEAGAPRMDARILFLDQGGDTIRSVQADERSSVLRRALPYSLPSLILSLTRYYWATGPPLTQPVVPHRLIWWPTSGPLRPNGPLFTGPPPVCWSCAAGGRARASPELVGALYGTTKNPSSLAALVEAGDRASGGGLLADIECWHPR